MKCDRVWRGARLATMAAAQPGLGIVENGLIAAKDGRIVYAGAAADAPRLDAAETIDCAGRWITPGLIDCHTHLVYAGDRAHEFELRLAGASYEEIARAGGIVSTVKATRAASEDALLVATRPRLEALMPKASPRSRSSPATGSTSTARRRRCAPPGAGRSAPCPSSRPFSARTRCRPRPSDKDAYIAEVATTIPGDGKGRTRRRGRRLLRGHRVLARADRARVRTARTPACR